MARLPRAQDLWDDESWDALSTRPSSSPATAGALTVLPIALLMGVPMHGCSPASWPTAASLAEEAEAVSAGDGQPSWRPTARWCSPPGEAQEAEPLS